MSPIELELQRIEQDCSEFLNWAEAEQEALQDETFSHASHSDSPQATAWLIPILAGLGIGLIVGVTAAGWLT